MKKLSFFLLFVSVLFSAQNQRFIYEYKFISDSTNREDVKSELMYLDISEKGSSYYSRDVFVKDSTMRAEIEKRIKSGDFNINMKAGNKGGVHYKVTKDYSANKVFLNTRVGSDPYKVLEDRTFDWVISSEKQKIGEFEAQKATTEFAGRKWTAWFSEELPFNDGPYKFRGLPGLIVKIEDDTHSHVMELKASTKFNMVENGDEQSNSSSSSASGERRVVIIGDSFSRGKEELEINRNQYRKLFWEDREDPAKTLKLMSSREGVVMKFKDPNGNDISASEMIKKREEAAKEAIKKNNNILEIDLLKK